MATFEKRGTRWRARVRVSGRAESKTFSTKAQAQAWALELEREIDVVESGGVPVRTLRQALARYLEEVTPTKRGAKWEGNRLRSWMGRIVRGEPSPCMLTFLDLKLADLSTEVLGGWRSARLEKVSAGSVLREINLMGAVLTCARREWRWMTHAPLKDLRRPPTPQARVRRVSEWEVEMLSVAMGWDMASAPDQYQQEVALAFALAIETAMRQGEILGLTWDCVDLVRAVAHLPITKNGQRRDVPLSKRAVELIELMRGRHAERVFSVSSRSADAFFRRARERCGIEDLHFHDSRREATSRLAKKVDVLTLARITGHRDIRQLMTYYQTDMEDVARMIG